MRLGQDTQAVLLLTARFGADDRKDAKPLGPKEWGDFADWLRQRGYRPAELVGDRSKSILADWTHPKVGRERLDKLLQRGNALALALEKWERAGIWVLTRAEAHYPARLKKRLGKSAPPVFFGCGNRALLDNGGLAVVGSRNADDADLEFCRRIGARAAAEGHSIVSGGARGVDETAMLAALEAEGTVVGVLANALMRAITRPAYRRALRSGDLVLVSPYHPDAGFQVGNAMGRNKYIYCLADAAVVATCEEGSGGTWAGATETLKHGWVPVWVRDSSDSAGGSAALVRNGARALPGADLDVNQLFGREQAQVKPADAMADSSRLAAEVAEEEAAGSVGQAAAEQGPVPVPAPYQAFLAHLEVLIGKNPLAVKDIQKHFELEATQTRKWLERAEADGLVDRVSKSPIRFQWASESVEQASMFG